MPVPETQSPSMRQRGSSWQIFWVQSKPGGHAVVSNALHSEFAGHCEVAVQTWYSRQRPNVALVQYWFAGQSVFVLHSASVHRPALQMSPAPPQMTSVVQRRVQVPATQV